MDTQEHHYGLSELIFDISKLDRSTSGRTETIDVDLALPFVDKKDGYKPKSNLTGRISLIKTQDTIEVALEDMHIDAEVACARCLKNYKQHIEIPLVERSFYLDKADIECEEDMFVDRKSMTLDANELVRQEIILHFPIVLVCSEGCHGIPGFEVGDDTDIDQRKPLAGLKEMWKSK